MGAFTDIVDKRKSYYYGGFVKEGKNKGKHKFTVGNKNKRTKYFTDYNEGKKWEAGERKIKYNLDKPKGKKFPKSELNKSAQFYFKKNYDDLNQKQKNKAYDRIRNVFRTTGQKKFKAKNLESPLSKTAQAKIKKAFPDAVFKQGQKYGFPYNSKKAGIVASFVKRGFKKAYEGGMFKSLPKYAQQELINAFPDVKFDFKDRSKIKTGASVAGYSKYGVPFNHPRYQSIRAYLDEPKPFRYGFNLRTAEGWTLGQMDRAALHGDTRYEPILQKPGKPISKNNKVIGIVDKTGKTPKRYNAENILKTHPNRAEIIKYVDVANKSRTPLADYPTIAKLLPEGFDPEKIQLNDLLQFIAKDKRGINRAKRAIEIHHVEGVKNKATGNFQLLRRDLNKLADTIEQQIAKGNLDRVAELDAQRIRVETGGVKYGGKARTPKGDFRALLKGIETELQNPNFKFKELAAALRKAGFKCKYSASSGGIARCDDPMNYMDDIKRNQRLISTGSPQAKARAFKKFNAAKVLGALGLAAEAGFVGVESAIRMGMGDTFSEALTRSIDYLVPGDQTVLADKAKISRELDPRLAKIYGDTQKFYGEQRKLKSLEDQRAELEGQGGSEFGYLPKPEEFDTGIKEAKKDLKSATVSPEQELIAERALEEASDTSRAKSFFSKQQLRAKQLGEVGQDMSGLQTDLRGFENQRDTSLFPEYRGVMLATEPDIYQHIVEQYNQGFYGTPGTKEADEKAQQGYDQTIQYVQENQTASLAENAKRFGLEAVYGFNPIESLTKINEPMPYERKSSYIPSPQQRQELEELIEEGARLGASSGGLMNLTRTVAPQSGPNSKGLESLRKYATKRY